MAPSSQGTALEQSHSGTASMARASASSGTKQMCSAWQPIPAVLPSLLPAACPESGCTTKSVSSKVRQPSRPAVLCWNPFASEVP